MKEKIITVLMVSISLVIVFSVVSYIARLPELPDNPSKNELIEFFYKNRATFTNITSTMKMVKQNFSFGKSKEKEFKIIYRVFEENGAKTYNIPKELQADIEKVISGYGFKYVYKDSGCIYFDKFTAFQSHKALIYSLDGTEPPKNRVNDFQALGDGWYYYYGE